MHDGAPGLERGLAIAARLAVVVLVQLLDVGAVGCPGEETLLIEQGQDTHGLGTEKRSEL